MIDFTERCGEFTHFCAKLILNPPCAHEDCTFDMAKESTDGKTSGLMRTNIFFDQLPLVNAACAMKLELAYAVIVCPRIAAKAKLSDIDYVYLELVSM